MARQRIRKKPVSDINVVPYIDVMLVLLVIFMITAPLLTQGVKVDLPQAAAEAVDTQAQPPLVVKVDKQGQYYLSADGVEEAFTPEQLATTVRARLRLRPGTQVLISGDRDVAYGRVVTAMALLQQSAGVPSVGLLTQAPEETEDR